MKAETEQHRCEVTFYYNGCLCDSMLMKLELLNIVSCRKAPRVAFAFLDFRKKNEIFSWATRFAIFWVLLFD